MLRSSAGPVWRLGVVAAALAALAGCGLLSSPAAPAPPGAGEGPGPAPVTGSPASATPAAPACPASPARFSCAMRTRIAAVQAFLRHRPGVVGVVLLDRSAGAVWENAHAHTDIYMASTSKLAMAVALLMQDQPGVIHLSAEDMSVMHDMLHISSDAAILFRGHQVQAPKVSATP